MSEWLAGLGSAAWLVGIAMMVWLLLGLLVAIAFGHLVAPDEGLTDASDLAPWNHARHEPRAPAASGQVAEPQLTATGPAGLPHSSAFRPQQRGDTRQYEPRAVGWMQHAGRGRPSREEQRP